ncbi:GGDEF family protein [Marinomonas sp. MED121]|uniref:GGDEF domain-containing protein n=1 Tax=Marinomonas sp. MED121 TaxID=314277 RepID=UPI000068FDC9|nr:GGDEF domain-containing protein [Marinomonas sp. MED121]EAQ65518.1 GGDEF family protein [Marinomonas sp. MED121]
MFQDNLESSERIFKLTIPIMQQQGIPLTPQYYNLWYTYMKQSNLLLNEQIDAILLRKSALSLEDCDALVHTFCNHSAENKLDKLQHQLGNISKSSRGEEIDDSFDNDILSQANQLDDQISHNQINFDHFYQDDQGQKQDLSYIVNTIRDLVNYCTQIKQISHQLHEKLELQNKEIQSLKKVLSEFEDEHSIDGLTGITNRKGFDLIIDALIKRQDSFSLILIDIDHFKAFNQTYGTKTGDKVLQLVAQKVNHECSSIGQIFRYSGGKFALILPNISLENASTLADAIRVNIGDLILTNKQTGQLAKNITVSLGASAYLENDTKNYILKRAEHALLQAKQSGRNKVMSI